MALKFKKIFSFCVVLTLVFGSMAGCSKPDAVAAGSSAVSSQQSSAASPSQTASSAAVSAAASSVPESQAPSSQAEDAQKAFLLSIQKAAQQGKVFNEDFAVKTNVIDDVQDKWGNADKTEYIGAAKGNYATYSKHNMVFGFNKGSQLFEVRSFDGQLKNIALSKVKEVFGTPAYDVKSGNDEIIGYVINGDYKILLVFPVPKTSGEDPKMDHYSVFYPRGTVNTMADDPGREW